MDKCSINASSCSCYLTLNRERPCPIPESSLAMPLFSSTQDREASPPLPPFCLATANSKPAHLSSGSLVL